MVARMVIMEHWQFVPAQDSLPCTMIVGLLFFATACGL